MSEPRIRCKKISLRKKFQNAYKIAFREKSLRFVCFFSFAPVFFEKTKRILLHFILNLSVDMHLCVVKLKLSIRLLIVVHQSIVVVFLHNEIFVISTKQNSFVFHKDAGNPWQHKLCTWILRYERTWCCFYSLSQSVIGNKTLLAIEYQFNLQAYRC